jgi:3-deoxy-D-manno-octulosonic-acid transferase
VPDRLPGTLRAYRKLTAVGTPLAKLLLSQRLKRGKEHPERVGERSGLAAMPRPDGALVWVHGASVGEMLAIIPLVERIRARGFGVLVTSGTVSSAALAQDRLPPGAVHQFIPLDAPRFIHRFLDHWRPNLALFAEGDLWPNLIMESAQRGIPLVLVNGRLSERSFSRWRRAPGSIAALLRHFDMCLTQSVADAERYSELGALRVTMTGNLKLDVPAPPANDAEVAAIRHALSGRAIFAAASTHPGEEAVIVDAHRRLRGSFPGLITVLAPRHPERGLGVVDIAAVSGLNAVLRSQGRLPGHDTDVYIVDSIGELGLVYRLAPIVFMGGSLVRHGGQNPIEAAKLGAAILHGPHVWNFAEIYAALDGAHGAEQVSDGSKLALRIGTWLTDPGSRGTVAEAALKTVDILGGALDRTLAAIDPYLMQFRLEHG